jgi:hypothetical protein
VVWRWVATEACGSHVYARLVPGRDYMLRATIHTADSRDTVANLIVEINGHDPVDARFDWEGISPVYSGRIPASIAAADGRHQIVFRLAPLEQGNADVRRLAISTLSLHPIPAM